MADVEIRTANGRMVHHGEDMVNHPPHYNMHEIEVLDIIEMYFPDNYHLGNATKYLLRSGYKGEELRDLKKLVFYVNRYIALKEADEQRTT